MLGVARAHLEQQAIVARNVVDLEHFRNRCQARRDATFFVADDADPDRDERQHAQVDGVRIHERDVASENPSHFQLADPLHDGGWREADSLGDVGLGDARVVLEEGNDAAVDFVNNSVTSHNVRILF